MTKQLIFVSRNIYAKRYLNSSPQESSIGALKKQVVYSLGKWQKQQFLSPCQMCLTKLSLVKTTPLFKYHRKTLILAGILDFQIFCVTWTPLFTRAAYNDLTEYCPVECKDQISWSRPSCKLNSSKEATILFQFLKLFPVNFLLKEILRGDELQTWATVSCFFKLCWTKPRIYLLVW